MKNQLSDRELTVLTLAVQGFTDDMIARELGIERGTVNSYWVRIRGKMGNLSRTELVARYVQRCADLTLAEQSTKSDEDAASLAAESKLILDRANAEIEHLRSLLADAKREAG